MLRSPRPAKLSYRGLDRLSPNQDMGLSFATLSREKGRKIIMSEVNKQQCSPRPMLYSQHRASPANK